MYTQGASCKPFNRVIRADIGDMQACGQKPVTFMRQVIRLIIPIGTILFEIDTLSNIKGQTTAGVSLVGYSWF